MKKKIIISVICAVLLCGIIAGVALSGIVEKPELTSLSDRTLYTVLKIYGFSIPRELGEETKEALINGGLRKVVEEVEKNPDLYLAYSYTAIANLYESVQNAVEKYYKTEGKVKLSELDEDRVMGLLTKTECRYRNISNGRALMK